MRRILFVDDEPRILDGLRRMLRGQRHAWEMVFAPGGDAGVAEAERAPFDVVVTDMRMPGVDGVGLLARVQQMHPQTLRIVLSGQTDPVVAARAARVAHQFLFKPCSPDAVRGVVERTCELAAGVPEELRVIVGRIDAFPVAEPALRELRAALARSGVSHESLSEIVERDVGMSAKVLQVINSSFFGISPQVTEVAAAVRMLGPGTMRELVLGAEVFRPIRATGERAPATAPLRDHSIHVARATADAVDGSARGTGYATGILHDVGKWILWDALPDRYAAIEAEARARGIPLSAMEAEVLGTTHARLGAYLLGIWNLPPVIVDAVAAHNEALTDDRPPTNLEAALRLAHAGRAEAA
ncbi:MAG TPA: HDOD domain-containing protein [Longimicrobiaceae bacterium]|nr:HDOD domain-containing protein [Longimicrobiaceae bacterium]